MGHSSSFGPANVNRMVASKLSMSLLTILLLTTMANVAAANSLYVIAEIINYDREIPIHAYDIGPDGKLTYQTELIVTPDAAGVVGLAADADSEFLFVTYEGSSLIGLVNGTTMMGEGVIRAPDARDLAGIVYDHGKELLYCVDRGTPTLYVYEWDPAAIELIPVVGSPFTLAGAQAYGIALDEVADKLYVGGPGEEIRVYSTADWQLVRTIEVTEAPISVAVDPTRQFLYYGGGYVDNFALTQLDLVRGTERRTVIGPDAGVMGLGVDASTGFVYTTTGQNQWGGGDDLLVFTSNLVLIQSIKDIGNPTGLVIPNGYLSYNPLHVTKTVEGPGKGKASPEVIQYATIGEEITYKICFNHNDLQLKNVTALDRLPPEISFVRATGDGTFGQYDPDVHTYFWRNVPLSEGTHTCLELVGRIRTDTIPGQIIRNSVTLSTQEVPPTTTGVEVIPVEGGVRESLTVTKIAVVKGVEGVPPVYVSPGEQVTYRIALDNSRSDETVPDVLLIDELPDEVQFVSATGDGVFGRYEPISHTYIWSYPWLLAGESDTVDLVVRVDDKVPSGSTITNTVRAEGQQIQPGAASVEVVVSPTSLRLAKTIVGGQLDEEGRVAVRPGDDLTYALEYANPSTGNVLTDVAIVDTLPQEVSFISADGDGQFGSYDPTTHTYAWSLPPLEPGAEGRLELVVRVNEKVEPNTVISNAATIRGKEMPATKAKVDVVVRTPDPSGPTYASVYTRPTRLYRNDPKAMTSVMMVVYLPEGLGKDLIADAPLVLTPGNIRPRTQQIFGTSSQGKVMAFFDPAEILEAIKGYGSFPVQITGTFKNGYTFTGNDVLYILDKP